MYQHNLLQLTIMERKGWIEYIRNKGGRVYALTEKGGKIVAKMAEITREIQGVIRIILKCYD